MLSGEIVTKFGTANLKCKSPQGLFELASKTYQRRSPPRRSGKRRTAVTGTIDFLDAPPSESAAVLQLEQRLAADAAAGAAQLAQGSRISGGDIDSGAGLGGGGGGGGREPLLIAGQSSDAKRAVGLRSGGASSGSSRQAVAGNGQAAAGGGGPSGPRMTPDLYGGAAPGTRRVRRPRQAASSDDDDPAGPQRSKTRPRELRRVRREIDAW